MTDFVSFIVKEVIGPGHAVEDANPTPKAFRQTPPVVAGVQHATPTGAKQPTGSQARTIPQPE
jgi:hypothetical protein